MWCLFLKSQTLIRPGLYINTIHLIWTWEFAKQRHPAITRIQKGLGFQNYALIAWESTGTPCSNVSTKLHDQNESRPSARIQPLLVPPCWQLEQIISLCSSWISKYSGGWWGGSFFRNCFEKWNFKAKQHEVHLYSLPQESHYIETNIVWIRKRIFKRKPAEKAYNLCGHESRWWLTRILNTQWLPKA